jgi:hypothetical protein
MADDLKRLREMIHSRARFINQPSSGIVKRLKILLLRAGNGQNFQTVPAFRK